jgi:hypothetical protein
MRYQTIKKFAQKVPLMGSLAGTARAALALTHYVQAYQLTLRTEQEKRDYLKYWQKMTGYRVFVETGTCEGRTTRQMASIFAQCFTVELDPTLYGRAIERLSDVTNVTTFLGDSAVLLPSILEKVHEPAIFYLDAHASGGDTARPVKDTVIEQELAMVFSHALKNHVILIDDARAFCGVFGYPSIRQLERFVKRNSDYYIHIREDIIVIHPDAF